jgi:membrane protein YdbS with pleckstrin-like domain
MNRVAAWVVLVAAVVIGLGALTAVAEPSWYSVTFAIVLLVLCLLAVRRARRHL